MSVDLTVGIVRIVRADGETAGTGFVVTDDGLIATCAHVVEAAGAGPGDTVRVVFHATGEQHEAKVEPDWWRAPDTEDVAILHLVGPLPERVTSLPLGSSAGVEGHTLTTFGFPDPKPVEGMAGKCEVVGRTTERGFPVLQLRSSEVTPGFSGAPVLDTITRRVVGMVTAITLPDQYGRLSETAFITPTETLRAVCPELQLSDLCPYQGLAAFTEDHAEFFFGRDPLVADLVDHLRGNPRFLAVVGPSGSGKSSVVRAGLFPALHRGEVPGSADWHLLTFRPGTDPFAALTTVGLDVPQKGDLPAAIRTFLETHSQVKRLVLFADQFEELFTLCPQPVQEQFLRQLAALLESNPAVTLILTLRADFYGHLLRYRPLVERLKTGQVNVPPMGPEELRAAVEEPALRLGLRFEPGLIETIVEEAGQADHPLPLLESALTQLWEKREDGMLTHAAYQAVGQVAGAIGQWAEDAYTELAPQERPLSRRIFTRLVRYGEGDVADTRQRQSLSELVTRPEEQEPLHQLVRRLADARLLVTGGDPGAETVEIIHDALLQQWGRLKHWTAEQREFYLWRQRLGKRLQEWEKKGQDEGALLHGVLLAEAERWLSEQPDELNPQERAYIQESVAVHEREQSARTRRRWVATMATVGAAVVFLVLALLAWGQRNAAVTEAMARATAQAQAEERRLEAESAQATAVAEAQVRATAQAETEERRQEAEAAWRDAERQAHIAFVRQLVVQARANLESSPQLGLLLAVEALSRTREMEVIRIPSAEESLRQVLGAVGGIPLGEPDGEVYCVAFSPDERWLAAGGWVNLGIRLWSMTDRTADPIVLSRFEADVLAMRFSPDGRWLATGHGNRTALLWDISNPLTEPVVLPAGESNVTALAFSPDARWLITGSDSAVRLWKVDDLAAGPVVLHGHEDDVIALAFSLDGRLLATGSRDGTVRVWNMSVPMSKPHVLRGHQGTVWGVDFDPQQRWLVTRGEDNTPLLWDVEDLRAEPIALRGHQGEVRAVAFSPDGHWLATGSEDRTVRLWDLSDLESEATMLLGHRGAVLEAAFSPNGHWLATGSSDATVRLWDLAGSLTEPVVLRGHEGRIWDLAFSPGGDWLATAGDDRAVRLWDLVHPTPEPVVLSDHLSTSENVRFSPDSHWLATSDGDNRVQLWDLTDLAADPIVLAGHQGLVVAVAFDPNSRRLATAGSDGTARLWDLTDPTADPVILRGHAGTLRAISFSPEGDWLATGSEDTTVRLWSLADLATDPLVLHGHEGDVWYALFSPDRRWLATGGEDTYVLLWDMRNQTAKPVRLESAIVTEEGTVSGSVVAAAFSPDGHWLATGSANKVVRLWDLTVSMPESVTLGMHEEGITAMVFSPDRHWLASKSLDQVVQVWDVGDPTADPIVLRAKAGQPTLSAVAFSPDNHRLATVSGDNDIYVWDMGNPTAEPITLQGHRDLIVALAYSPDGSWLATGSTDGTVSLWRARQSDLVEVACRTAARNLSQQEWQQYIGDEPYRPTCPNLPVPEE